MKLISDFMIFIIIPPFVNWISSYFFFVPFLFHRNGVLFYFSLLRCVVWIIVACKTIFIGSRRTFSNNNHNEKLLYLFHSAYNRASVDKLGFGWQGAVHFSMTLNFSHCIDCYALWGFVIFWCVRKSCRSYFSTNFHSVIED